MRKIYLASGSKARQKLLKVFGFKFRVLPSRIKERRNAAGISYAALVKANALEKAEAAARKVKSGVVIAADTITVRNKKIFGKPKGLKHARRMLLELSRGPQWVYSGLAVIDVDKNKKMVSFEKTKVYMDKLFHKDIDAYFKKVSPLGKAGSFDIQGRGAFFIRRIEGCFYNVVGLPIRKLYHILKKLNVGIIALFLFLSGCSTEYNVTTGQVETYYYSTDREVALGATLAKQVQKQFKLADDPLLQDRVESVGKKIVAVCDRKDIDYHFYVLDDKEINAFSLPGGYVYVNSGLLEKVADDNELASVIGHEVGHIVARHSIKRLQAAQMYTIFRVLTAATKSAEVGAAADTAITELMLGYSREDEFLADQLGSRYEKLAGYDPNGTIRFLVRLQEDEKRKPPRPYSYFRTHPHVPDRIRAVKQELGLGMNFDDYINTQDQPRRE